MQTVDIVFIAIGVALLILGYIRGFGKSLRTFTSGVFGIVISVFVCVAFGGMILGTPKMTEWVGQLNDILTAKWEFLGKIQAGVIIYYVALFVVTQIVRIIIVKLICGLFEADNGVMKVINRILGMIFAPAIAFAFLLLVLAVLKCFEDSAAISNMLAEIDGSILKKLYDINPIVLRL